MRYIPIFIFLLLSPTVFAQLIINGQYEGKNLYFQNPFSTDTLFCTEEVWLNGEKVLDYINSSAFEVKLDQLDLHQDFELKVFHKTNCKPKLMNRNLGCNHKPKYEIKQFLVTDSTVSWKSKADRNGTYWLERFENYAWTRKVQIKSSLDSSYSVPVCHFHGLNKYRIMFVEKNGIVHYSNIHEFTSTVPKLVVAINEEEKRLVFSRSVDFELLNWLGEIMIKGKEDKLNLSDIECGIYYLNADNKTYRIKYKIGKIKVK